MNQKHEDNNNHYYSWYDTLFEQYRIIYTYNITIAYNSNNNSDNNNNNNNHDKQ